MGGTGVLNVGGMGGLSVGHTGGNRWQTHLKITQRRRGR
jgi:hypothetical protein